ncbi:MAG: immunity 51 family protein, partial [Ruminococcus sp.]|nr:immunity 51 family protein [Ruminococcus sp.]
TLYDEKSIIFIFYIENERIIAIRRNIEKYSPDVLENMDSDPEAEMYVVYYENTPENNVKVKKFAEIIEYLIENPDDIYEIVRQHSDEIEWD